MATIFLETLIRAPCSRCFDISRSIGVHIDSMDQYKEKAIAGKTSGLIGSGETVTWRARHFLLWFEMTSVISRFDAPMMFRDEMVAGPFRSLSHDHIFTKVPGGTLMTDIFHYTLPCGILTIVPDLILVRGYLRHLLKKRNEVIKARAESDMGIGSDP